MQKLHFSIVINKQKEHVWNTMLNIDTYRLWTDVFAPDWPDSHYVGDWSKGSKMLFIAPDEKGQMSGMVSRIRENLPYQYLSIEHIGIVQDGKEDTSSEAVKEWAGALENYTFKEIDGTTEVSVDMDIGEEYEEMFQETWPKALQKLKELAEK